MSVSLRASSNVTYVNVPIDLYVDVDVGFEPTPWDVYYYYIELVIETYKGGSLYRRDVKSYPLEVGRRFYSWTLKWSVPEADTYSVRAGCRLVSIPLPYSYEGYVWSEPITVSVQAVPPEVVPPPEIPPELLKWLGVGVLGLTVVVGLAYALRKKR